MVIVSSAIVGGELVEEAQHFLISPQIMDDEVIDDLLEEAYPFLDLSIV